MDWIQLVFGEGKDLNALQMTSRAVVVFFITLALIRIAGIRTFGKRSAMDNVVIIMLGSILSRAVAGASPFMATVTGCLAFVLVHRGLAWLSLYSDLIGKFVKGEKACLYANGSFNEKNMRKARVSDKDIKEGLRLAINEESIDHVEAIYIERNGEISVIKKK
ncbi:DUF421 domain-containing protein [Flavitalea sp. BT771]|uniref:DUF421 domain-containing protein n=1 Tax=Flavitalea sp. BT771 TaxID=3063329 RepID=UPI0026E175B7|nr:YetF domain-containing protein [Flavitalea sp. BT771]MDO6430548.1 DUF421 domain-containing protein [Flavitalea sp. BT771]MDV6219312.1 DUF421 domain-containing protein [Flavitalea sp. BT771]